MNQKQIFQEKLRGIRTNETYNPLGVNLENNLVIEVNEVLNPSKIEHFFFILINCGGQRFKTKGFKGGRVNEAFNGSIEHGTENIYVKLVALRPQGEEIIGEQMVHISEITDQLKHDFTLSLLSENGIETPYRLNLSIQWIHSKVSYYEQIIDKLEKEVEILVTDRNDYELDLEWLILPFNKTVKHHSKPQIYNNYNSNQPIQIQIPDSLLISQGTREGMFMATNQGDNNLKRSKVFKQENELKESAFSDHNREKNVKGELFIIL